MIFLLYCNLLSEFLILFAVVAAGEESELLVGIKNDGTELLMDFLSVWSIHPIIQWL